MLGGIDRGGYKEDDIYVAECPEVGTVKREDAQLAQSEGSI